MSVFSLFTILLISTSAFASKARRDALADSPHLIDSQSIFKRPLQINELPDFISLETGLSTPTGLKNNAEGSISYALSDKSRVLLALGHQDEMVDGPRQLLNTVALTNYSLAQNPLHLFYGYKGEDTNYAVSALFSKSDDRLNSISESSSGLSLGVEMGGWQFFSAYTFMNAVETGARKFDGSGYLSANIYYNMDSTTFYLTWNKSKAKSETAGIEDEFHDEQMAFLGIVDSKVKDENDFFWGAQIVTVKIDCHTRATAACDKSFASAKLPVWFGIESQVKSWLVLRGSVAQTVLVDQSKDEVGYPAGLAAGTTGAVSDITSGSNSTVAALGAGLVFKNVLVDGTLKASNSQVLNQTDFLTQAAITYNF